ncbi:MAG: hypothetical protein AAF193_12545 [Bacteroidota bacterium]
MKKSLQPHLERVLEMRKRGERYPSIIQNLRASLEEKDVKRVIREMDRMETEGELKRGEPLKRVNNLSIFLGSICILAGIGLLFFTWNKGFLFALPFVLIGVGVLAFLG